MEDQLNIDITLSERMAKEYLRESLMLQSDEHLGGLIRLKYRIEELYNQDLFFQIWHQKEYTNNKISIEEALAFERILLMIQKGNLFMSIFYVDSWAKPDKDEAGNIANVQSCCPIKIWTKGKKCSDGFFKSTELINFHQVLMDDEEEEVLGDLAENFETDVSGYVEFGAQSVVKTAASLLMGHPLLRVPYAIAGWPHPVAVILHNKKNEFYNDFMN